jgi:hypothetical protein
VRLLIILLVGCAAQKPPQDPRCPVGWTFDPAQEGFCSPPDGYAGVLWVELGGSGIYGFARSDSACEAGDPMCDELVSGQVVNVYPFADLMSNGIRQGAPLLGTTVTSAHGLYKLRIQPGDYAVTTVFATHLFAGEAKVVSNTVALFPFELP